MLFLCVLLIYLQTWHKQQAFIMRKGNSPWDTKLWGQEAGVFVLCTMTLDSLKWPEMTHSWG